MAIFTWTMAFVGMVCAIIYCVMIFKNKDNESVDNVITMFALATLAMVGCAFAHAYIGVGCCVICMILQACKLFTLWK